MNDSPVPIDGYDALLTDVVEAARTREGRGRAQCQRE